MLLKAKKNVQSDGNFPHCNCKEIYLGEGELKESGGRGHQH